MHCRQCTHAKELIAYAHIRDIIGTGASKLKLGSCVYNVYEKQWYNFCGYIQRTDELQASWRINYMLK